MAPLRAPLQGVGNIVRFNWHFYAGALALALVLVLSLAGSVGPPLVREGAAWALGLLLASVLVSLAVSAYVYDFSGLYQLGWLPAIGPAHPALLTVSAGFDETTVLLEHRYAPSQLLALDFYDPARHTEVSIRRARQTSEGARRITSPSARF